MKQIELAIYIYDDFKLKKTLWYPWFIQKYFSVVRIKDPGFVSSPSHHRLLAERCANVVRRWHNVPPIVCITWIMCTK